MAMGAENGILITADIGFSWKGINKWDLIVKKQMEDITMVLSR